MAFYKYSEKYLKIHSVCESLKPIQKLIYNKKNSSILGVITYWVIFNHSIKKNTDKEIFFALTISLHAKRINKFKFHLSLVNISPQYRASLYTYHRNYVHYLIPQTVPRLCKMSIVHYLEK